MRQLKTSKKIQWLFKHALVIGASVLITAFCFTSSVYSFGFNDLKQIILGEPADSDKSVKEEAFLQECWNGEKSLSCRRFRFHSATLLVAATDSLDKWKANFIADGVDDQVEIQMAIDALPENGGRVVLLEGTYNLKASGDWPHYSIDISKSNVILEGQGYNTVLKNTEPAEGKDLTHGLIRAKSKSYVTIRNLRLDGNWQAGTADNAGMAFLDAKFIKVEDCFIGETNEHWIGLWNVKNAVVTNSVFWTSPGAGGGGHHGIDMDTTDHLPGTESENIIITNNHLDNQSGQDTKVENTVKVTYSNNHFKGQASVDNNDSDSLGLRDITYIGNTFEDDLHILKRTGTITIIGNQFFGPEANVNVDDHSGPINIIGNSFYNPLGNAISLFNQTAAMRVSDNFISGPEDRGIAISGGTGEALVVNNQVVDAKGTGIQTSGINHVFIDGNLVSRCAHGIRLINSDYSRVSNNIAKNSTPYPQHFGIYIEGKSDENQISANSCYDDQESPTQHGGIFVESGATNNRLIDNNCWGNKHGQIYIEDTSTIVRNNRGFLTENSGTATITSEETQVEASHGLNITPQISNITVVPTNNLGNASKFWISDVNKNTFRINVDSEPGESEATFAWQINSY